MPSADQVTPNNSQSRMLWHEWVVLIAGSTGSALRTVRPPNLHITPVVRRDLVYRASATGSLYRSPLARHAGTLRTNGFFSAGMSVSGQNRKSSMRAYGFRVTPDSGHATTAAPCPKSRQHTESPLGG